jgi:hypothetical protein
MADDLPEFRDWSRVAVLLMRGVVYSEDDRAWNVLLVECFDAGKLFRKAGLAAGGRESDGMAYLRQLNETRQQRVMTVFRNCSARLD